MKAIQKIGIWLCCLFILAGCRQAVSDTQNPPIQETHTETASDTLIVFYSLSGNTKKAAQQLQRHTNATLYEITIETPYPDDMQEVSEQAENERKTKSYPALKGELPDLSAYKRIFIGGPVWSHTVASPLLQFMKSVDFTGKDVIPFWTDAGDPGDYEKEFAAYLDTGVLQKGIGFSHVSAMDDEQFAKELQDFLKVEPQKETKIKITAGDTEIHAVLNTSEAAQELKAQLPLTLTMTRMGEHEYYSALPKPLSEKGKKQTGYEIGDLAYWTPGDLFALYFDEPQEEPEGLLPLGRITSDISLIRQLKHPQEMKFELE